MIIILLKKWKWVGVVLGAWIFLKISQDISSFVA